MIRWVTCRVIGVHPLKVPIRKMIRRTLRIVGDLLFDAVQLIIPVSVRKRIAKRCPSLGCHLDNIF